jgi:toxin FitB
MLEEDFAGRVLVFDGAAAEYYAPFMSQRRRPGRPTASQDGQIAAIALSRGAAVATRNTADFQGGGVELINPWDAH